jgi:peroxiredoxin
MKIGLRTVAGVLLAGLALAVAVDRTRADEGLYKVGDAVDGKLAAKDLDGKSVALGDLKGKVVFLNFFAIWCGPCNVEAPNLKSEIYEKYKAKGLVLMGATSDADGGRKFKEKHGLEWPILVDESGALFNRFVDQYIPWNAIIDRDGKLRYTHVGFEKAEIEKVLDELLKSQ